MQTAKGAKSYVDDWNEHHNVGILFGAFVEEMKSLHKITHEMCSPGQFGSDDLSGIKEFNLKARKLSSLVKQPDLLPEDWFEKKIRELILGDPEVIRVVHCFDGAAKGGWRPYPLFVDWMDFCGFHYDDVSGNAIVAVSDK